LLKEILYGKMLRERKIGAKKKLVPVCTGIFGVLA
jgi:hypothetical protein